MEGANPGKNRKKLAVMGEKVQERVCKIWSPLAGYGIGWSIWGGVTPHTDILLYLL